MRWTTNRRLRQALPDPACTPGAYDPRATAVPLSRTICRAGGHTASVRPASGITEPEKRAAMRAYRAAGPLATYEYDHMIPLSLGGARPTAATSGRNPTWVARAGTSATQGIRSGRISTLPCAHGGVGLVAAQRAIAANWTSALPRRHVTPGSGGNAGR